MGVHAGTRLAVNGVRKAPESVSKRPPPPNRPRRHPLARRLHRRPSRRRNGRPPWGQAVLLPVRPVVLCGQERVPVVGRRRPRPSVAVRGLVIPRHPRVGPKAHDHQPVTELRNSIVRGKDHAPIHYVPLVRREFIAREDRKQAVVMVPPVLPRPGLTRGRGHPVADVIKVWEERGAREALDVSRAAPSAAHGAVRQERPATDCASPRRPGGCRRC